MAQAVNVMSAPIQIDPNDPTPLYAQLDRAIRVAVATGKLVPGDQLPTVRQLAVALRVNANTVAKVYLALEREGFVETKRGVGTFIAESVRKVAHAGRREQQLRALIERFLTDAHHIGFSPREAIDHLRRRLKEGDQS
jgi:GntR family transcriptional regulator